MDAKNMDTKITKKDLNKVVLRGVLLQLSWNFERMQALGYCYTILPILKKIYKNNPEGLKKAVQRNLEFFNTNPFMAAPIMGITLPMEEKLATDKTIDPTSISAIKIAMMGPLAGIGDSLFWFTILPICAGIGVSLSKGGNILGPIAFLILWNIPNLAVRYFGVTKGYELGTNLIGEITGGSVMQRITNATTIVGLMVLGVMTATMVNVPLNLTIGKGSQAMTLQAIFDGIMPNLIPLGITYLVYRLIKKGKSVTKILFGIIIVAILGAVIGIF